MPLRQRDAGDLLELESQVRRTPFQPIQIRADYQPSSGLEALSDALGRASQVVERRREREAIRMEIDAKRAFTVENIRDVRAFNEAYPQYKHLSRAAEQHFSNMSGADFARRAARAYEEHVVTNGMLGGQPDEIVSSGNEFLQGYLAEVGAPKNDAFFDDGLVAEWEPFISKLADSQVDQRIKQIEQRQAEIIGSSVRSLYDAHGNNPAAFVANLREARLVESAYALSDERIENVYVAALSEIVAMDPQGSVDVLGEVVKADDLFNDPHQRLQVAYLYRNALRAAEDAAADTIENTAKAAKLEGAARVSKVLGEWAKGTMSVEQFNAAIRAEAAAAPPWARAEVLNQGALASADLDVNAEMPASNYLDLREQVLARRITPEQVPWSMLSRAQVGEINGLFQPGAAAVELAKDPRVKAAWEVVRSSAIAFDRSAGRASVFDTVTRTEAQTKIEFDRRMQAVFASERASDPSWVQGEIDRIMLDYQNRFRPAQASERGEFMIDAQGFLRRRALQSEADTAGYSLHNENLNRANDAMGAPRQYTPSPPLPGTGGSLSLNDPNF